MKVTVVITAEPDDIVAALKSLPSMYDEEAGSCGYTTEHGHVDIDMDREP